MRQSPEEVQTTLAHRAMVVGRGHARHLQRTLAVLFALATDPKLRIAAPLLADIVRFTEGCAPDPRYGYQPPSRGGEPDLPALMNWVASIRDEVSRLEAELRTARTLLSKVAYGLDEVPEELAEAIARELKKHVASTLTGLSGENDANE